MKKTVLFILALFVLISSSVFIGYQINENPIRRERQYYQKAVRNIEDYQCFSDWHGDTILRARIYSDLSSIIRKPLSEVTRDEWKLIQEKGFYFFEVEK